MTINMKVQRILNYISVLTLIASLGFVLTYTYWQVYPYKTLEINKTPMEVVTKKVKPGGVLVYKVDYCKFTDETATITKAFIDGVIYNMPAVEGIFPRGCGVNVVAVTIPHELPAGVYEIAQKWTYPVNPIRRNATLAKTEPFEVLVID